MDAGEKGAEAPYAPPIPGTPAGDADAAGAATPYADCTGAELYAAKCATCHGAEGKGDGPAAGALPRKPRDFSTAEFWSATSEEDIRTVILKGRPGSAMRGYPMDPPKLDSLVAYLETFKPEN